MASALATNDAAFATVQYAPNIFAAINLLAKL